MLQSPRLDHLQNELTGDRPETLAHFWRTVETAGTPLVEPMVDDDTHVWATFLWQATEPTTSVTLISGPTGWDWHQGQFTRLGDTDLWYLTLKLRSDARFTYALAPNLSFATYAELYAARRPLPMQVDPLNRHTFPVEKPWLSVVALPAAKTSPWLEPHPDNASGTVTQHTFRSALLGNTRTIGIYTPPGYTGTGEPCDLLLLTDGDAYTTHVPTPQILDNLLHAGRIAPTVAVFVHNVDLGEIRAQDLSCNPDFAQFLVEELHPWVREHHHVTADPARTVIGGASLGGLTAAYAAFRYPQVFGNVLAQSGSFWWRPAAPEAAAEPCWLTREYRDRAPLPVRFYLEVGLMENSETLAKVSMLQANRHLRDVLLAKGYAVHYAEFSGGHDWVSWAVTLADGVLALVGHDPA